MSYRWTALQTYNFESLDDKIQQAQSSKYITLCDL